MLPMIVSDKAIGVFVLYTSQLEFFDADGLVPLTELAGNVAFAIDHLEKQERLDYLSYYDTLTGLANRSLFLDRLTQYMRSAASAGHKLALLLIDLERFKKINDTLGRPAGDALLKLVAEWLTEHEGDANVLGRVDADHFALILPEVTHEADAARVLEKTITAFLNHPFRLNNAEYRISAKVGVALFPDDGTDADTLFKNTEAAVKKAKTAGDRYLFYAQKMTETVAGSLGLENRLRQALEQEEFVLHYQPKVNISSGQITGAEALIRWNDPQNGLTPPGRFIPILEETGLIYEVGRWALQKAIGDYQRWRRARLPMMRIAVNVSPLQLRNRSFLADIEQAISIAPDAASGLELELTETLIMEDVGQSIGSLLAIRALGVTIAIDDFGTGFSSLSYLSKLPVDTLKIDRSFVTDMIASADGLTLVSVIINLAHALKLKVVAEGVETAAQLRELRLLKCDEMQGYLFGRPVPAEVFEERYLMR
jgi:diguanylate cyclase (GGDEF)-like protein